VKSEVGAWTMQSDVVDDNFDVAGTLCNTHEQ